MIVTTTASLLKLLFTKYQPERNITLTIADILLLVLSIASVILAVSFFRKRGDRENEPARGEIA
jgi:hypothetical protein